MRMNSGSSQLTSRKASIVDETENPSSNSLETCETREAIKCDNRSFRLNGGQVAQLSLFFVNSSDR